MSDMLVIARDNLPGDALCALPTICGLAARHDRLYLAMTNRDVLALADLPANVIDVLRVEPAWRNRVMPVQMLGVAAACGYNPTKAEMHPSQYLMAMAGLDVARAVVPQPKIRGPNIVANLSFDVVIAPWTDARERGMTHRQVHDLISMGYSRWECAVVGGKDDPIVSGADRLYGQPFPVVISTIRHAKVVVTVDSFPNRLAHAAGIERHILLASPITPHCWSGHPGVTFVDGALNGMQAEWNIRNVVKAIEEKLEQFKTSPQPA